MLVESKIKFFDTTWNLYLNQLRCFACQWQASSGLWSCAKILEREGHRKTRQVKESIWIRKEPTCMNRDGGTYSLPTAYDRLLVTCSTSTSHDHKPDEARRWRAKRRN